jgi:hypothetical protein
MTTFRKNLRPLVAPPLHVEVRVDERAAPGRGVEALSELLLLLARERLQTRTTATHEPGAATKGRRS